LTREPVWVVPAVAGGVVAALVGAGLAAADPALVPAPVLGLAAAIDPAAERIALPEASSGVLKLNRRLRARTVVMRAMAPRLGNMVESPMLFACVRRRRRSSGRTLRSS
jgi:hypothetical protein